MAKAKSDKVSTSGARRIVRKYKVTSIGNSKFSKIRKKRDKKRGKKVSRGQG